MKLIRLSIFALLLLAIAILSCQMANAADLALSWTAPDGPVDGYEIRWVSSNGNTGIEGVSGEDTSFVHTGLDAGQTITYQMYAFNSAGYSGPSETLTIAINPLVVVPDGNLTAPIYVQTPIPVSPDFSYSCSVDVQCEAAQ